MSSPPLLLVVKHPERSSDPRKKAPLDFVRRGFVRSREAYHHPFSSNARVTTDTKYLSGLFRILARTRADSTIRCALLPYPSMVDLTRSYQALRKSGRSPCPKSRTHNVINSVVVMCGGCLAVNTCSRTSDAPLFNSDISSPFKVITVDVTYPRLVLRPGLRDVTSDRILAKSREIQVSEVLFTIKIARFAL